MPGMQDYYFKLKFGRTFFHSVPPPTKKPSHVCFLSPYLCPPSPHVPLPPPPHVPSPPFSPSLVSPPSPLYLSPSSSPLSSPSPSIPLLQYLVPSCLCSPPFPLIINRTISLSFPIFNGKNKLCTVRYLSLLTCEIKRIEQADNKTGCNSQALKNTRRENSCFCR
jgi:hypothetical protein